MTEKSSPIWRKMVISVVQEENCNNFLLALFVDNEYIINTAGTLRFCIMSLPSVSIKHSTYSVMELHLIFKDKTKISRWCLKLIFFSTHLCALSAAVLFWLNYKAAYDNWNEQRLALNKDIHMATKEVVDKLPGIQQTSAQAFSTLFLQLTVNDLGICLPITNTSQVIAWFDFLNSFLWRCNILILN